jgi:hypothetical protein
MAANAMETGIGDFLRKLLCFEGKHGKDRFNRHLAVDFSRRWLTA